MIEPKVSTNNKKGQGIKIYETLEKRVLNSNLNDEDKIALIQLIGNHPNIISIPSVWASYSQPIDPTYRDHRTDFPKGPDYIVTCFAENDACPHANVSCLDDRK